MRAPASLRLGWASRSIRNKLAIPFALVMGAIALFVSLYFPSAMERRERDALLTRARSVASVAAFSVRSAVVFEDVGDMEEPLRGVFEAEEVVWACVRAPDGTVLAELAAPDSSVAPADTTDLLRATAPVGFVGREIARVEVHLSQANLRAEVDATRRAVQAVAAAIFFIGLGSLVFLSRLVTGPLLGIVETVERISEGDLTRRAPLTTNDEVAQLASSFNVMVDRLQSTQQELEQINQELEERVEERTLRWQEEQSQRLRAEEEKSKIERFYEQVLDALPLEIAVFDLQHRFLYLNPATVEQDDLRRRLIGARHEDAAAILGVPRDVNARRGAAVREATETGCLVSLEEQVPGPDARERFFLRVYSPMLSSDGAVTKVVAYGVDVTGRRMTERALRLSEEKLRQSQKMEAVGRLAGGIAHDFNNLLTVITGHTDLLMGDLPPDSPFLEELDQMKHAAGRAAALTSQLLAFSRQQVLQPRLLDPNTVVADVERMLSRLIGEHIRLVTTLAPDIGRVRADPGQLQQVLMNLAVNARDAMPRGGTLTIETSEVDRAAARTRWGDDLDEGHYCLLAVRDTGIGMDDETRERVFEPFFTTKEVGKGTGLGLATVYGIVTQSGGSICVDSELGSGTEFRMYLPLETGDRSDAAADGASGESAFSSGKETVLLVEDETTVRNLVRRILGRAGYEVLVADGGQQALTILRGRPQGVDLLFTDVVMPGMPGHELAAKAREVHPGLRVLFMSGYTDDALIDRGALEDGVVLLQKPFAPERALQVVRRVLDGEEEDGALSGLHRASESPVLGDLP